MNEHFPNPKSFGGKVKVELDLSSQAKQSDLKNVTEVDTSKFTKCVDLAKLKT